MVARCLALLITRLHRDANVGTRWINGASVVVAQKTARTIAAAGDDQGFANMILKFVEHVIDGLAGVVWVAGHESWLAHHV